MDTENITFRKLRRTGSLQNISHSSSSLLDDTIVSLPNVSMNESQTIIELNETIRKLSLELQTANEEIDNLNLENTQLKSDLDKCNKIISTYKKLQFNTSKIITPKSSRKRKNHSTPNKNSSVILASKNKDLNEVELNTQKNTINMVDDITTPSKLTVQNNETHKVLIITDQRGYEIQKVLQTLLGSRFKVFCFSKPGANMTNLVSTLPQEMDTLTKDDFVILLGGQFDNNPNELKISLQNWIYRTNKPNILICQTPYNKHLNEEKLNYEVKHICTMFPNSLFVDMRYESYVPNKRRISKHISQTILKDILHLKYKMEYQIYTKKQIANQLNKRVSMDKTKITYYFKSDKNINRDSVNHEQNRFFRDAC